MITLLLRRKTAITHQGGINPATIAYPLVGQDALGTSGVVVTPERAMRTSDYFAVVRILANSFSAIPFHVIRRKEGTRTRLPDHPVAVVLRRTPNPTMLAVRFKRLMMKWVVDYGNAFAAILRNGLGELMLVPIHPVRVRVKTDPTLPFERQVSYEVLRDDGQRLPIAQAGMFHTMGLTSDGWFGISMLDAMRETVGISHLMREHMAAFWKNLARPGYLVETPTKIPDSQRLEYQKQFQEAFSGSGFNAWLTVPHGWKFTPIQSMEHENAQFTESRRMSILDLCRVSGIPPHKLAELTDAHYDNIEQGDIEFVGDAVQPYVQDWEEEVRRKLLADEPDVDCNGKLEGLLRSDSKTRAEVLQIRRQNGTINADEIRALEDEDPLPDNLGSMYLVNGNMVTSEELRRRADGTEPRAAQPQPPPMDDGDEDESEEATPPVRRRRRAAMTRETVIQAMMPVWTEAFYRTRLAREAIWKRKGRDDSQAFWDGHMDLVTTHFAAKAASLQVMVDRKLEDWISHTMAAMRSGIDDATAARETLELLVGD